MQTSPASLLYLQQDEPLSRGTKGSCKTFILYWALKPDSVVLNESNLESFFFPKVTHAV